MKKQLNKSEIQKLNEEIKEKYKTEIFTKKDQIDLTEKDGIKIILKNGKQTFFYHEQEPVPTLKLLQGKNFLKKITVDMGAIKFVINGADIMRPGITKIDDKIDLGENVAIIDETHNKIIAVCKTLLTGKEIKEMNRGKALKNIHHVGDKIWNLF